MKKLLLLFVCAASFAGAQAQANFGLKAGLNIASFTGDVEDVKSKIGFNVGGFAELPLASAFSLRPEVVFSSQGAKAEGEGEDVSLNLGYLNVPVLGKWTSESGFFAETGPQVGFLLNAKVKADNVDVDMKDYYKSIDFSWAFGIGYEFAPNLGVNGRYNLGLSNIAAESEGEGSIKNSVIQVGLFYKFGSASASR